MDLIFVTVEQQESRVIPSDRARTDWSDDRRISDGSDGFNSNKKICRQVGRKSDNRHRHREGNLQSQQTPIIDVLVVKVVAGVNAVVFGVVFAVVDGGDAGIVVVVSLIVVDVVVVVQWFSNFGPQLKALRVWVTILMIMFYF